jgi:hypothetical protein
MRALGGNEEKFVTEAFDDAARERAIEKRERWRAWNFWALLLLSVSVALSSAEVGGSSSRWQLLMLIFACGSAAQLESELRLLRVLDRLCDGSAAAVR